MEGGSLVFVPRGIEVPKRAIKPGELLHACMHTQSSNLHFARKDFDGPLPRRRRRRGRQRGLPRGQQRGSGGGRGAKVDDGSGGSGAFLPSPLSQPNLNSRCESAVGRGVLSYMRVSERR